MNKNTLVGMLLMGAVILLFSYLSQPSAEERERMAREQAEMQAQQQQQSPDAGILTVDSVNAAELANIAQTVRLYGSTDSISGITTLNAAQGNVVVTLDRSGKLGGSVHVTGATVPLSAIETSDYSAFAPAQAAEAVRTLRSALAETSRYGVFARHTQGDVKTVTLANDVISLEISNKGGVISSATLKDYQRYDSTQVTPIAAGLDSFGFTLTTANQRFDTRDFFFTPVQESDSTILMQLELGDGAVWGIRYTLPSSGYLVKMDLVQRGMNAIIPPSTTTIDLTWEQKMQRNEAGRVFEERNSAIYYMLSNGDVDNLSETSDDTEELQHLRWIGYKNQFFSAVLIPATPISAATLSSSTLDEANLLKSLSTKAVLDYSNTAEYPASFTLFIGPNSYPLLSDIQSTVIPDEDLKLTKLIPLGWSLFRWINTLIVIPVFDFLGGFISSYGIIILLLTIFIKIILFPFTYKSYMSQAKMRVLAPEVKAINDKYPGQENAMRRQQETMALYSRAGASPFSGCLPMLLQMPILIAMFNFFPSAIELRGQSFLWAHDLSAPDAIYSWTTNIPFISSTFGNHISLFCLLMTVVNIIYTRINMQNQPGGSSMPGMKMMMYLMPVMFLFFFNNYASGLSYYYFLSLLITIIQTYIFRKVVNEEKVRAQLKANAAKPKKKSGFMARLEEAQRRQQAMMREQEKQRNQRRGK